MDAFYEPTNAHNDWWPLTFKCLDCSPPSLQIIAVANTSTMPPPTISIAMQHHLMGYVDAIGDVIVCRMTAMLMIEDGMTRGQYSVETLTYSAGRISCAGTLFKNRWLTRAYLSLIGDPRQFSAWRLSDPPPSVVHTGTGSKMMK